MNNFELWKMENGIINLTIEQFAIKMSYRACGLCPVFGNGDYCRYHLNQGYSCKDGILRWANDDIKIRGEKYE